MRLGLLLPNGGEAHLPPLRALCQRELGWDDARWESEARDYLTLWRAHYALPGSPQRDGTAGPNLRPPSLMSGPVGLGSSGVGSGRPNR